MASSNQRYYCFTVMNNATEVTCYRVVDLGDISVKAQGIDRARKRAASERKAELKS